MFEMNGGALIQMKDFLRRYPGMAEVRCTIECAFIQGLQLFD